MQRMLLRSALLRGASNHPSQQPSLTDSQLEAGLEALLEEMQSNLKVFVYDVQDDRCTKQLRKRNSGYMVEDVFLKRIHNWTNVVADPSKANAFFVPTTTSCWRFRKSSRLDGGIYAARRVKSIVDDLKTRYDFFRQLNGTRHFWVSSHDMGKAEAASFAPIELSEHASCMVNTADPSPRNGMLVEQHGSVATVPGIAPYAFNPRLDISLPCNSDQARAAEALRHIQTSSWSTPRKYNAFFAGSMRSDARKEMTSDFSLAQVASASSDSQHILNHEALWKRITGSFLATTSHTHARTRKDIHNNFVSRHLEDSEYLAFLSTSEFCLCPRGFRVWSPRLFDAVWFGCIPVIIADEYHLPHSCFLNWSEMSVHVPEARAHQTADFLANLSQDWKSNARQKLLRLRKTTMWHEHATTEPDAFSFAMMEFYVKQFK
eukprot:TRINITY_DN10685_c0_g1_i1.p1 TRINITY_DN10685_c0_g1~~TRINITY_DN10685_c0_g1_i1.p1  ORF type:complete len:432 (+),score=70.25 TRINITY_DN10685_c0_g1_i1:167-1462(+)